FDDQTPAAERFGRRDRLRQVARKFERQFADRFAHAHQYRFAAVIDLSAGVIERVERRTAENEQVFTKIRPRQNVFKKRCKIAQVLRRVREQKKFCQRKLAFAENAETGGKRFARITFADDRGGERVETGFAVAPKIAHGGHHHGKQRRQKFLQIITDEKILLPRFADDRRRIYRVLSVING